MLLFYKGFSPCGCVFLTPTSTLSVHSSTIPRCIGNDMAKTSDTNVDDTLRAYAKDLSKVRILKRDEERKLFKSYREVGDLRARDAIIESCLRYVVKVAHKYAFHDSEKLKDLIAAGNEGLLLALDRFDLDRGTRFMSYAAWYVLLYIRDESYKYSVVRVPMWRRKISRKIRRCIADFTTKNDRDPVLDEIMALTGFSEKQVVHDLLYRGGVVELHPSTTEDPATSQLEEHSIAESGESAILKILSCLPVREQFILRAYFGIDFDTHMPLKQIASILGISSERVRQIKISALQQAKKQLKLHGIASFDDILG